MKDIQVNLVDHSIDDVLIFNIPGAVLEPMTIKMIGNVLNGNGGSGDEESKNLSRLIRTAVKGLFLMYGDKILTMLVGKDHAKPAKKDDILEWYTRAFALILLNMAASNTYTIDLDMKEDNNGHIPSVSGFNAFPLPVTI